MSAATELAAIPAPPRWDAATLTLSYQIGEVTLWRKSFRALSLGEHYSTLTCNLLEPAPPFDRLGRDADVIVTRSHPVQEPLPRLARENGVLRYVRSRYTRFHADLQGDFEGYLAKFSAKSRGTLRRKVRRYLDLPGAGGVRVFRRPEEMEEFHRLAREVSALTYQERLLDAGIPAEGGFLQEMKELAAADAVRAYLLVLEGRPIAYLYCPARDGILMYGYLGYDPRHAELSPGTVLQYLVFESLFAEKAFRAFDFTEGQGEHKRFFGTHETLCADVCYFPASAGARFWVSLHVAVDGASASAVRLLERLGLKARVKKFFRRR